MNRVQRVDSPSRRLKYQMLYGRLCHRAYDRQKIKGLTEGHHILPSSQGGPDDEWNIVNLTIKEHRIAHRMLYIMDPDSIEMFRAYRAMCFSSAKEFVPLREYEELRKSHLHGGENHPRYGMKHSEESKEKMRGSREKFSVTARLNMSEARKKSQLLRDETSIAAKVSETKRNKPKVMGICPHCNRSGNLNASAFKRWHFNNCKLFKES